MDILNIEDLEDLVKKEYFNSLAVLLHGKVNKPYKLCKITNPRLRIIEFEKQGNFVPFSLDLCYLFQNVILNELNFAILYGFDRYKSNDAYIKKEAKEIVLKLLENYPNIKSYDYETPPLDLNLTSNEKEYANSMDQNTVNYLISNYNITFDIFDIQYIGDVDNIQILVRKLPPIMIAILTSILSNDIDKLKENKIILESYGFILQKSLSIKLSDEKVHDLYKNNFNIKASISEGDIFISGTFPVIPLYNIAKQFDPKILENINIETKKACILKFGKYRLPDNSVELLEDTTLQDIINKYEYVYDIIYVISCKYSDEEIDIKESLENPKEFSVPKADKGEKRKKYFFL